MEPADRVVRHFQEELEQLKRRLLEMGGLAEEQVRVAIKALVDREVTLIERDRTNKIFTAPSEKLTEDYLTGRFG